MQVIEPPHKDSLQEFFNKYGDEIESCNPSAYDQLVKLVETLNFTDFDDFIYYYSDELEACHDDAFDILYEIAIIVGIKI